MKCLGLDDRSSGQAMLSRRPSTGGARMSANRQTPAIGGEAAFRQALAALPPVCRRRVSARFVAGVLPLSDRPELAAVQRSLAAANTPADELIDARMLASELYARGHPRGLERGADYCSHARYLVLEAVMACLQADNGTAETAESAATYCRLARICDALGRDGGDACRSADKALRAEIEAQYRVLSEFLSEISPSAS